MLLHMINTHIIDNTYMLTMSNDDHHSYKGALVLRGVDPHLGGTVLSSFSYH